ncbi:hypothetical protein TIFTF001_013436 [Ficus carica]|uniref:Uncharacterized protein n=1 Tax=Ficus carica TaxID=3494 RepID=A0AA87ZUZ1_FICCA|nr:hypothetical protein TIFTF001_013436 [Ficus carica]
MTRPSEAVTQPPQTLITPSKTGSGRVPISIGLVPQITMSPHLQRHPSEWQPTTTTPSHPHDQLVCLHRMATIVTFHKQSRPSP